MTARFDLRRPRDGDLNSWRIVAIERLTYVQGLYRLQLDASTQFVAREFTIQAQDVQFTLHTGYVFQVNSGEGVTGLVLLGRGEMQFSPGPATEKGQLRIFGGSDTLTALFGAAFVRLHPADYETRVNISGLKPMPADPRQAKRAQEVFATEAPKSFNIDLRDLSRGNVVHPSAARRFPRGGPHEQVRHADLRAQRRQRRGHHALRSRATARDRAVRLALHAGAAGPHV